MGLPELILIAAGLSMDAFAVAVCKGLSMGGMSYKNALITACYFGGFQALMPFVGFLLGTRFEKYITSFDHWIAFGLLAIIGLNMIKESRGVCPVSDASFKFKDMTLLALATSIDALAAGFTFAVLQVRIVPAVFTIGLITFIISFLGVKIGNVFGHKYHSRAELFGGLVLIAIGAKILLEHLGVINRT